MFSTSHFPSSRNSTQKQTLLGSSLLFRYLICLFFDCKHHLHLSLFSLIVMAFPACTCEAARILHSFEFLCVVLGLGVQVWLKRYLHPATRVSVFSPFSLFAFYSLSCIMTHVCFFITSVRSLRVGSRLRKVNTDQN